jgi:ABC-type multidrug transport system fused ATPase/permease subunit
MVMAFTINTKAALIFVAAIPVLSAVVFGIMLVTIPLYKKVQTRLDRVLGITRENLSGARVIRAFGKEESETKEFFRRNAVLTSIQKNVGRISALMNPITYVIINLAIIVLLSQGASSVNSGSLTQGQLVALYNYMSQILVELIKLANLIINITKSVACANRIESVFEIPSGEFAERPTDGANPEYSVEFQNVSLKYKNGGENSLTDISFSAKKGDVIGIIGGTGSGKTSLVNLIPAFYKATEGNVFVNGQNVKTLPTEKLRNKIGIVPQKAVLFKGTIRENMLWGNENASDGDIFNALETAQAKDVVLSKDGGLDADVSQGGRNFSGGQRQRLTIARALVRRPEILILDDSASALDFATDAALRRALHKMAEKPTVFIVSQRTSSIRSADKIIVLDDGKAVGIGSHDELLKNCGVYREIYNSQFKKEAKNA